MIIEFTVSPDILARSTHHLNDFDSVSTFDREAIE